MTTVANAPRPTHPASGQRTPSWLDTRLAPVAAQLAGTIRDYGPDDFHALLATVPHGDRDHLIATLAAMVNPDASIAELLAWTTTGPVTSGGDGIPPVTADCPGCGRTFRAKHLARHRAKACRGPAEPSPHPDPIRLHRMATSRHWWARCGYEWCGHETRADRMTAHYGTAHDADAAAQQVA